MTLTELGCCCFILAAMGPTSVFLHRLTRIKTIFIRSHNGKKVACGAWKLDQTDTNEESLTITEIINHPNYVPSTNANDIAILKVSGSFNCVKDKIYPACLPNTNVR